MKVLIVEHRDVVRCGLAALVAKIPEVTDLVCVGRLRDEAVTSVDAGHIDIMLTSASALIDDDAVDRCTDLPVHRTILLLMSAEPHELDMATAVKADGYLVLGDVTVESIRTSFVCVLKGDMPLPAEVASYLLRRVHAGDALDIPNWVRLTPRESDVLMLLVEGMSNQQVASALSISVHAVKRHVSSLLNKYGVRSRTHLASQVLRSNTSHARASTPRKAPSV